MKSSVALAGLLVLAAIFCAGCTGSPDTAPTGDTEQGKIYVSGAFALYPMMIKWSEEYQKIHPGVSFEISAGGAGKGMTDALSDMVDIGMVSREIYPEEQEQGAFFVAVTKDAVVGTINDENPGAAAICARGVTRADLEHIYVDNTVTNWQQLAGLEGTDVAINQYTRSDACGAASVWAKYIGGYNQEDLGGIAVYGDPGLADAVCADTLGAGFNNINYAYDPTTGLPIDGLQVLPLDLNENGVLDPEENFYATRSDLMDAIAAGTYPSPPARDLYFVTHGEFSGPAKAFTEWVLTDGQQYVTETGYIPLQTATLEEERAKIA